jgi:hypothetical protein
VCLSPTSILAWAIQSHIAQTGTPKLRYELAANGTWLGRSIRGAVPENGTTTARPDLLLLRLDKTTTRRNVRISGGTQAMSKSHIKICARFGVNVIGTVGLYQYRPPRRW